MATKSTPVHRRPRLVCVWMLALLCGLHATALAVPPTDLVVDPNGGAPFSTLAGAVAAAPPGSIIHLRPGTYNETVIIDKNLSLVGRDVEQGAVLDGEDRRRLLHVTGAVTCRFENLVFRDARDLDGSALLVDGGAVVDVINCTFHDNLARRDGGAVAADDPGTWVEFIGCHFQRNRAFANAGAMSVHDGAEATLRRCTFFANTTEGECGAVSVISGAPLAMEDCLFLENLGYRVGAVMVARAPTHLVGCTFFQNTSLGGATVSIQGPDQLVVVTNNIFASDLEGAGLDVPRHTERGCNLYFDNLGGPLLAGEPNEDELVADPCFCDFPTLDLTLQRTSPASGRASDCGRIGALDVGCLEGLEAAAAPRRRVR